MKRSLLATRHGGFSLLEVLCALAVLVVLAMLALPAFSHVRAQGQASSCTQRLRHLGVALQAYVAEHEGRLIPAASLGGSPATFWFDELDAYMGETPGQYDRDRPYEWQLCPAKPVAPKTREAVGYGWSHRHFGHVKSSSTYGSHARLSDVTRPAQTIIIADSVDLPEWEPPESAFEARYLYGQSLPKLARRHLGKGHYLMLDGHVERFTPEEVWENGTGPYRRWWFKKQ